jgi:hypothetical protein
MAYQVVATTSQPMQPIMGELRMPTQAFRD